MNNNPSLNAGLLNKFEDMIFWKGFFSELPEVENIFGNCEALLGYNCEELLCKTGQILSLVYDEDVHDYKKRFCDFALDSSITRFSSEFRLVTKQDTAKWVKEEISFERDDQGNVTSVAGLIININEFKNSEAELINKYKHFEELNGAKDRFISILSHDLRAPFTSILGFSEILLTETSLSESERHEYLNYIHDSSNNQLHLINYLLDWSRLHTGRLKVDAHRMHAQTIVYNCVSSLTGNAIRKNIEIKISVPDQLYVNVDEKLISQVITNLVSNAIKFSPEYKKIDIIADSFDDDKVEFIIKDQGVGISEVNKEKIFKVDKMFSTEGTKGERGTGLGLNLVKEIIEKHQGDIWFYSKKDVGSEFHFTVPFSKSKILIIETDNNVKEFIGDNISGNYPEFEVVFKKDGYDAMSVMYSTIPSLIILNHNIPFMDGAQFVKFVRENEKDFKIPVIVLIDKINEEVRKTYQTFDVSSFLKKPLDPIHLNKELSIALE